MLLVCRYRAEYGDTWPRCGCHRWTPCRVNKANHPTRRPTNPCRRQP